MSSPLSAGEDSQELSQVKAAMWLGAAYLVALLVVCIFTAADFASAAKREGFSETTAVGDSNFFRSPPASADQVFTAGGRQFVVASQEKAKIDDTDMVRIARDETSGYTLYTPRSKAGGGVYVKIEIGEYLPLKPR
jgi:hypothetical protein